METAVEKFIAMTNMFGLKELVVDDMQRNFKEMKKDREFGKLLQYYQYEEREGKDYSNLLFQHLRMACAHGQAENINDQSLFLNPGSPYSQEVFKNMDMNAKNCYYAMVERYVQLNMQHYEQQPVKTMQK